MTSSMQADDSMEVKDYVLNLYEEEYRVPYAPKFRFVPLIQCWHCSHWSLCSKPAIDQRSSESMPLVCFYLEVENALLLQNVNLSTIKCIDKPHGVHLDLWTIGIKHIKINLNGVEFEIKEQEWIFSNNNGPLIGLYEKLHIRHSIPSILKSMETPLLFQES